MKVTSLKSQNQRPMENILFFFFLGPHLCHMEFPWLGVESELQLPAYTTATATWDPSHVCDLHQSSWHGNAGSLLSKARDQTHVLMDASRVHYHWAAMGTPSTLFLKPKFRPEIKGACCKPKKYLQSYSGYLYFRAYKSFAFYNQFIVKYK